MAERIIYPTRSWLRDAYPREFREVCNKIQQAVQACCPDEINRYAKVNVLGIHWSNDTIGVKPLTSELLNDVFRDMYNFATEIYEIATTASNGTLYSSNEVKSRFSRIFQAWIAKNEGDDNLLIVYYSGHGQATKRYSGTQFDCFEWT